MNSRLSIEQEPLLSTAKINQQFRIATRVLFGIAVAGQLLFVYYIIAFYGGALVDADYERINEQLGHGVIKGDTMGNAALAVHIFLAAIITLGGPIQFINGIRNRFPTFHRWNGRIYYVIAFLISFAGLYMNYSRGAHGGMTGALGNALNAVLIMSFSVMAWRTAMQRDFRAHKKWAIRAFLMVSGVWFFRVGYGLWILLTGFTAPGTSADLTGPFDRFLSIGHSLVPLLIIEGYFIAKAHPNPKIKRFATGLLGLLCLLLTGGIVMIAMIFWFPNL